VIAIVDYGMGNLRSVQKACEKIGLSAQVTSDVAAVQSAAGGILPGGGAFGTAMEHLAAGGMADAVRDVIARETPFLGICLGLQLLFEVSEEFGEVRGLGVLPGRVRRLFPAGPPAGVKVPHMGWNSVAVMQHTPVLADIPEGSYVYFVHSYCVAPGDRSLVATETTYSEEVFASSVARGNLFACQFHPEKSSAIGLRMLRNFGALVTENAG
jgi:imidazole glycerol-phosphate synthase subunit HisH